MGDFKLMSAGTGMTPPATVLMSREIDRAPAPSAPPAVAADSSASAERTVGRRLLSEDPMPFFWPNVKSDGSDLASALKGAADTEDECGSGCGGCGAQCPGCSSGCLMLLGSGQYGFTSRAGVTRLHTREGPHCFCSPSVRLGAVHSLNEALVTEGNVTVIRILAGTLGWIYCDGALQILLPGVHVRRSRAVQKVLSELTYELSREITTSPLQLFNVAPNQVCTPGPLRRGDS